MKTMPAPKREDADGIGSLLYFVCLSAGALLALLNV